MIPGCLGSDHPRFAEAAKYMLDHATQICTGLDYIHEKGYTHRNMKLEKVLVNTHCLV
jgi:serine/threonine protein kinase